MILPKRNENDLDDVPEEIKKSMKFIFVETVDEVLDAALEPNNHKRNGLLGKSAGSKRASKKKTTTRKSKSNGKDTAR